MKQWLAAVLLALPVAPTVALAEDCVLDHCADRKPLPSTPAQAPAPGNPPSAEASSDSRGDRAVAPGRFDFYVLALSWSPSYCANGGASRSRAQCAAGANPGFVVHGLWPQYDFGYPSRCSGNGFLPYSVLAKFDGLYPDEGLARHEWRQHGVCSGKPPAGYFADVQAARAAVTIPVAFKAPDQDRSMSPLEVQRAFIEANPRLRPGMMAVTCRRGALQEARICLSKDLRAFVACPQVARQGCFSQSIVVPAGR